MYIKKSANTARHIARTTVTGHIQQKARKAPVFVTKKKLIDL